MSPIALMKFDLAYCLSLDDKLSIYDVRDLNFDETMAFDSAKEHFQCPNDACRSAFDAANVLTTFNAKNVRWGGRPDDSQLYFQLLLIYPCVSLVVVR